MYVQYTPCAACTVHLWLVLLPPLCADVSAIPGAPSPIPSDGNAALDAITIQWSSVPFTASPLLYNVAYTLTRTNGSVESGSELVRQWATCAGMYNMYVHTYLLLSSSASSRLQWRQLSMTTRPRTPMLKSLLLLCPIGARQPMSHTAFAQRLQVGLSFLLSWTTYVRVHVCV